MIRENITEKKDPVEMYYPMLNQIKPEILVMSQAAIDRSKIIAQNCLKQYMLKSNPGQATKVAEWLSEGKKYKSHGKGIDYDEAKNVLKLNVEKIDPNTPLWNKIWE